MQCQICNENEATVHLTEINDGKRTEMHLCERCAAEQGLAINSQIPLNELLSNLLAVQPTDDELSSLSQMRTSCPHCGLTLEDFRKEGVLGCPYDYEVFEKLLLPLIERAHEGKTTHCGKLPSKASMDTKKHMELLNLRQRLEVAVQSEDYEQAAKLRDEINKIEK